MASGLRHATDRPIRTRFRYGSAPSTLNLATYQQLAGSLCKRHAVRPSALRRHSPPTACKRTVSGSISLPSPGFFSPFPHGTGSLSVAGEYLALEGGPPRFLRGFTCPVVLGYAHQRDQCDFVYGAITRFGGTFQSLRLSPDLVTLRATPYQRPATPSRLAPARFGLFPFRSPLLRESSFLSLPRGTEMFQFPRFASRHLWIQ